jgi:hypothetical protein
MLPPYANRKEVTSGTNANIMPAYINGKSLKASGNGTNTDSMRQLASSWSRMVLGKDGEIPNSAV